MKPRGVALLLLPALILLCAPAALAEDGEAPGGLKEKIKKKMEGILELMKQNEAALLKLSTGAAAKPRKVDVDVPPPPAGSKGGAGSDGSGGAKGGDGAQGGAGAKGREIGKKLDELIKGQRKQGGAIPDQLKELVEMIPLWSSCSSQFGSQQKQDRQQKKSDAQRQQEQEAREARNKRNQQDRQNESEPKDGSKRPENPADKLRRSGTPEDPKSDPNKRDDDVPAWMATLPPEIRDAFAGGRAEDVPAKYRHLLRAYHLWLQKNRK